MGVDTVSNIHQHRDTALVDVVRPDLGFIGRCHALPMLLRALHRTYRQVNNVTIMSYPLLPAAVRLLIQVQSTESQKHIVLDLSKPLIMDRGPDWPATTHEPSYGRGRRHHRRSSSTSLLVDRDPVLKPRESYLMGQPKRPSPRLMGRSPARPINFSGHGSRRSVDNQFLR